MVEFVPQNSWNCINTLRPRQNWRHIADDTFNCILAIENVRSLIEISLKFVPKGPINNIPALVLIMAWRSPGDKPFLHQWWLIHWRIFASLSLNELCYTHASCSNDASVILYQWKIWPDKWIYWICCILQNVWCHSPLRLWFRQLYKALVDQVKCALLLQQSFIISLIFKKKCHNAKVIDSSLVTWSWKDLLRDTSESMTFYLTLEMAERMYECVDMTHENWFAVEKLAYRIPWENLLTIEMSWFISHGYLWNINAVEELLLKLAMFITILPLAMFRKRTKQWQGVNDMLWPITQYWFTFVEYRDYLRNCKCINDAFVTIFHVVKSLVRLIWNQIIPELNIGHYHATNMIKGNVHFTRHVFCKYETNTSEIHLKHQPRNIAFRHNIAFWCRTVAFRTTIRESITHRVVTKRLYVIWV